MADKILVKLRNINFFVDNEDKIFRQVRGELKLISVNGEQAKTVLRVARNLRAVRAAYEAKQ